MNAFHTFALMEKSRIPLINTLRDFSPLKEYFLQNRLSLTIGLVCLLIVDFLQLLIPLVIKSAVDYLTYYVNPEKTELLRFGLVILSIALVIGLLRYIWRLLVIGHSRKVEEQLRNRLFSHLQFLSISFYRRMKTGDIMARSINDINAVRMASGMGLVSLVDGLIMGVSAIGFMIYISPRLALYSLLPAPFIVYFAKVHARKMSRGYERVQKSFSDLTESAREVFAGIRVIKSFVREEWGYERMKREGRKYVNENIRLVKILSIFFPMMTVFTSLGMLIVIFFGGRLAILGDITTGDFVAFIGYLNLLAWPMMAMGWVTNLFQRGAASMRRISGILNEVPEIQGPHRKKSFSPLKGEIRFNNVSVRYPGKSEYALSDFSFKIEAGSTVSLVGMVGSGKSSLLYTLPRLLDPSKGNVCIDGIDIKELPLNKLRSSIGFVTQNPIIFSDTIRNNIVFGRNDITEMDLVNILKCVKFYDDVLAMEKGLDAMLGERGITLSGGQKQRLTIARAIVSNPAILILDDSLSMIDTRTEEEILNNILAKRSSKTNLIVSHRFTTISRADSILVLKDGMAVEWGDHNSLLKNGTEFKRLYEKQLLARELEPEHF